MTEVRGRAAILGAGISGMLAAAALQAAGFKVTMVERVADTTNDTWSPQDAQLHNVLGRAQKHLEELLPDFRSRFLEAGGTVTPAPARTHVFDLGVRMPQRELGLEIWSAPKPVIASVVRAAVAAQGVPPPVSARVTGVVLADNRCVGVQLDENRRTMTADLVVDASGAATQAPQWLAHSGAGPVPRLEFDARQWYTTVHVDRPDHWRGRDDFWLVFPHRGSRGGLVSPLGPDAWVVSLSGGPEDAAPRTFEEFVAGARLLEDPWIWERLVECRPASAPKTFNKPVATWRRYDQMDHPVKGFLALGDALCSLNPLYGQGISVAAWEAALLRAIAFERLPEAELAAAYHRAAATTVEAAWALMTSRSSDPAALLGNVDWGDVRATVLLDHVAHRNYVEVWHLLRPATWLTTSGRG